MKLYFMFIPMILEKIYKNHFKGEELVLTARCNFLKVKKIFLYRHICNPWLPGTECQGFLLNSIDCNF